MNYLHSYETLDDFYTARGGRISGESDYGAHNIDDLGAFNLKPLRGTWGDIRVSHVHSTGDFYALEYCTGHVVLLGFVDHTLEEAIINEHLSDWADCKEPGRPLSWFKQRLLLNIKSDKNV